LFKKDSCPGCYLPVVIYKTDTTTITKVEKIEVFTKDTVITTEVDSVMVLDTLFLEKDCPNVKDMTIERQSKKGNVKATVSLNNGVLSVRCDSDSLKLLITNLRQIIRTKDGELISKGANIKVVEKEVEKIKHKIPKWVWILLLFNIGYFCWKFRKPILKLIKL
jgi:hypothetical protein